MTTRALPVFALVLLLSACAGDGGPPPESRPAMSEPAPTTAPAAAAGTRPTAESPSPEAAFLADPVQLTFPDRFLRAGEAYFNPDVSWIIFQAIPKPPEGREPSPHYSMYVARLWRDGKGMGRVIGIDEPILLSEPGSANTCGWFHPSLPGVVLFGSTIVEPDLDDVPGYSRDRSRYVWQFPREMNVVSRTVEAIVHDRVTDPGEASKLLGRPDVARAVPIFERDGYCAEGSWSSDARTILFTAVDPETGDGDLFVYIVATGEIRALVVAPGYDGGPFYSPDGRHICYRSDRAGNDLLQLFVSELEFDVDGLPSGIRREHQLTANEHVNWAPYWHPSGTFMVYASSEVGHYNYEVFAVPFDPERPDEDHITVRITHSDGFDGLPVFSPDGSLMMWTAQRGKDKANRGRPSSQLWLADVVMRELE